MSGIHSELEIFTVSYWILGENKNWILFLRCGQFCVFTRSENEACRVFRKWCSASRLSHWQPLPLQLCWSTAPPWEKENNHPCFPRCFIPSLLYHFVTLLPGNHCKRVGVIVNLCTVCTCAWVWACACVGVCFSSIWTHVEIWPWYVASILCLPFLSVWLFDTSFLSKPEDHCFWN